jgi:hypothetical protein
MLASIHYRTHFVRETRMVQLVVTIQTRIDSEDVVLGQWPVTPGPENDLWGPGMDYMDGKLVMSEYRKGRCYAILYDVVTGEEIRTFPCGYGETPVPIHPKWKNPNCVYFSAEDKETHTTQVFMYMSV